MHGESALGVCRAHCSPKLFHPQLSTSLAEHISKPALQLLQHPAPAQFSMQAKPYTANQSKWRSDIQCHQKQQSGMKTVVDTAQHSAAGIPSIQMRSNEDTHRCSAIEFNICTGTSTQCSARAPHYQFWHLSSHPAWEEHVQSHGAAGLVADLICTQDK